MYIHCLGHFSYSASPPPPPPQFQTGPILPLSLILLKKGHMHNKKDEVFLLVELRRAIQKDSYYCFHVPMCYDMLNHVDSTVILSSLLYVNEVGGTNTRHI
jgi:hypothetical protein